jgi:hypothetical protein
MSKYAPLADHLRNLGKNEVTLSFDEIEQILGSSLPPTASRFRPYWSNSGVKDGHPGRLWREAGWRQVRLDLAGGHVSFRRADAMPSDLESLKPQTKGLLYDLLQQAGFSVEEWHKTSNGDPVENYRSNPRFCYEWCFGSIGEGFALCFWYGNLTTDGLGRIVFDGNIRETHDALLAIAKSDEVDAAVRLRAHDQAARAKALDDAIHESFRRGLAARVIVCEGDRRRVDEIGKGASSVAKRYLDVAEWYVHAYDSRTGACLVVREVEPEESGTGDVEYDEDATYDEVQNRAIKTRRGQPRFRRNLLDAYRKSCAITGSRVVELLEAAHIVPHSLMTDYSTRNGLLLRTDIHTLFDLNLLSVDERCVVHVSRTLSNTDYWQYHGKRLKTIPDRSEDQPSAMALGRRHESFREAEGDR